MATDLKIALRKTDYREGALTEEEQRIFWFCCSEHSIGGCTRSSD